MNTIALPGHRPQNTPIERQETPLKFIHLFCFNSYVALNHLKLRHSQTSATTIRYMYNELTLSIREGQWVSSNGAIKCSSMLVRNWWISRRLNSSPEECLGHLRTMSSIEPESRIMRSGSMYKQNHVYSPNTVCRSAHHNVFTWRYASLNQFKFVRLLRTFFRRRYSTGYIRIIQINWKRQYIITIPWIWIWWKFTRPIAPSSLSSPAWSSSTAYWQTT